MLRFKYNIFKNDNNNNNLRKLSMKIMDDNIRKFTEQINTNKNNNKNSILLNYLSEQNNKILPEYLNFNNNNNNNNNFLFLLLVSFFAGYQFRYYIQRKLT